MFALATGAAGVPPTSPPSARRRPRCSPRPCSPPSARRRRSRACLPYATWPPAAHRRERRRSAAWSAGRRPASVAPGGTLLYLSRDDLESLGVTMLEVVDAVDAGCAAKGRGEVVMPPKLSLHGEGDAYSQVMAATLLGDGGLGAKWVTLFPQNAARGLPITNGLVVLSDPETGLPSAVMDAATVTAWRTGASVGVAARYLARPDADRRGCAGLRRPGRAAVGGCWRPSCPGSRGALSRRRARHGWRLRRRGVLGRELPGTSISPWCCARRMRTSPRTPTSWSRRSP